MAEQSESGESFPKRESTGEGSNAGHGGEGQPRTGEGGEGEGRTQDNMAGQGTGQIKGPHGDRQTSR